MFKRIFFGHRVPGWEPVPGGSGTGSKKWRTALGGSGSGSSTLGTAGSCSGSMKNDRVLGYAHP